MGGFVTTNFVVMSEPRLLHEGLLKIKKINANKPSSKFLPNRRKKSGFRLVRLYVSETNEFQFQFYEHETKQKSLKIGVVVDVYRNFLKRHGAIIQSADGKEIKISGASNNDIEKWSDKIRDILWPINDGRELFDLHWLVSIIDTKESKKLKISGRFWLDFNQSTISFVDVNTFDERFLIELTSLQKVELLPAKAYVDQSRILEIIFLRKISPEKSDTVTTRLNLFSRQAEGIFNSIINGRKSLNQQNMSIKKGPETKTFKKRASCPPERHNSQGSILREWLHKSLPSLAHPIEIPRSRTSSICKQSPPSADELKRVEEQLIWGTHLSCPESVQSSLKRISLPEHSAPEVGQGTDYRIPLNIPVGLTTKTTDDSTYHMPLSLDLSAIPESNPEPTKIVKARPSVGPKPQIPPKPPRKKVVQRVKSDGEMKLRLANQRQSGDSDYDVLSSCHTPVLSNKQQSDSYDTLPLTNQHKPSDSYDTLASVQVPVIANQQRHDSYDNLPLTNQHKPSDAYDTLASCQVPVTTNQQRHVSYDNLPLTNQQRVVESYKVPASCQVPVTTNQYRRGSYDSLPSPNHRRVNNSYEELESCQIIKTNSNNSFRIRSDSVAV